MRDQDLPILFHFIRRPEMYTGASKANDYKRIDTFLIAYEMGSMRECQFRDRLIKQIEDKYNVPFPSEGLGKQLRIASKKANQEIRAFFIAESTQILIAASDQGGHNKFVNQSRKRLIERLEQFPEAININWIFNFSTTTRELKAWTGVNLTTAEMNTLDRLIDEVNQLIKHDVMEEAPVPEDMQALKDELLGMLKKQLRAE